MKTPVITPSTRYQIAGRIVSNGEGVHGLTVAAYDRDPLEDDWLGSTITDRSGQFTIRFSEQDFCDHPLEGEPDLALVIKDRAGKRVRVEPKIALVDRRASVCIELSSESLRLHLSRPLRFETPREIYPQSRIAAVEHAILTATRSDARRRHVYQEILSRLIPSIQSTPDLLSNAVLALGGDHTARGALARSLEFTPGSASGCGCGAKNRSDLIQWPGPLFGPFQAMPGEMQRSVEILAYAGVSAFPNRSRGLRFLGGLGGELCRYRVLDELYQRSLEFKDSVGRGGDPMSEFLEREFVEHDEQGQPRPRLDRIDQYCEDIDWPPEFYEEDPKLPEVPSNVWAERWFRDAFDLLRDLERFQQEEGWSLVELSPEHACPGNILRLVGINVGDEPVPVTFPRIPGTEVPEGEESRIAVNPERGSWIPLGGDPPRHEITIEVPENAGCGYVGLALRRTMTRQVGERFVDFAIFGSAAYFDGTRPHIKNLRISGFRDEIVEPGETVPLVWEICPAQSQIQTVVRRTRDGQILEDSGQLAAPAPQGYSFDIDPGIDRTTPIFCEVRARNDCMEPGEPDVVATLQLLVHRVARVGLDGMEITQVVQYFRADKHMDNPGFAKPDNSIPLIHRKPTLVRVYFSNNQVPHFNGGLTTGVKIRLHAQSDTLELETTVIDPENIGNLNARNSTDVDGQRGKMSASANFILPEEWTYSDQKITLWAELALKSGDHDVIDQRRATTELSDLEFIRLFDIRAIVVRFQLASAGNLVPTAQAAARSVRQTARALPTKKIRISYPLREDRVVSAELPVVGFQWEYAIFLLYSISLYYDDGGTHCIWTGVLPNIPLNLGPRGLAWPGKAIETLTGYFEVGTNCAYAAFRAEQFETAIHEYGHTFEQAHPGGGGVIGIPGGYEYPSYNLPNYGHQPLGAGEYGIDVQGYIQDPNTLVKRPQAFLDIMVRGDQRWPSPYFYEQVLERRLLEVRAFASLPVGGGFEPPFDLSPKLTRQPRVFLVGTVWRSSGRTELEPVFVRPSYPKTTLGSATDLRWMFLNSRSEVLFDAPVHSATGDKWQIRFAQALPFREEATSIELRDGAKVLHRIERSAKPSSISELEIERSTKEWTLRWKVEHPEGRELAFHVSMTSDGGESWFPLNRHTNESSMVVEETTLPGGKDCRIRLYASDGFDTVWKETEPFEVEFQKPELSLVFPSDGEKLTARRAYLFEVEALDPVSGDLADEMIRWISDQQGELGRGSSLIVRLQPGTHRIQVSVDDEGKMVSETSGQVIVAAPLPT